MGWRILDGMKRFPWRAKCGRLLRQLPLRGRGVVLLAASGLAVSQLGYGRLDLVALALGISERASWPEA